MTGKGGKVPLVGFPARRGFKDSETIIPDTGQFLVSLGGWSVGKSALIGGDCDVTIRSCLDFRPHDDIEHA